jgi:hypothetical protein
MADTRCQLECEDWVRLTFLSAKFGQPFHRERLRLSSGGVFDFDAVSTDQQIAATISTSGAATASGKHAVGKVMKLRSDMLFLLLAAPPKSLMVLTEEDMYRLCLKERQGGRVPTEIDFLYAELPAELAQRLRDARRASSAEVSPGLAIRGTEPVQS